MGNTIIHLVSDTTAGMATAMKDGAAFVGNWFDEWRHWIMLIVIGFLCIGIVVIYLVYGRPEMCCRKEDIQIQIPLNVTNLRHGIQ